LSSVLYLIGKLIAIPDRLTICTCLGQSLSPLITVFLPKFVSPDYISAIFDLIFPGVCRSWQSLSPPSISQPFLSDFCQSLSPFPSKLCQSSSPLWKFVPLLSVVQIFLPKFVQQKLFPHFFYLLALEHAHSSQSQFKKILFKTRQYRTISHIFHFFIKYCLGSEDENCPFCDHVGSQPIWNERDDFNFGILNVEKKRKAYLKEKQYGQKRVKEKKGDEKRTDKEKVYCH
jgi:hypothetical protein